MAKGKGSVFFCQSCGYESTKWMGQCPACKEWNTMVEEVVDKKLAAMDLTASIMCLEQKMPMLVFGLEEKDSIVNAVHGKFTGTKVTV